MDWCVQHLINGSDEKLFVAVEPWGEVFVVNAGSKFAVHFLQNAERESYAIVEHTGSNGLSVWIEQSNDWKFEVDGEILREY